GAVSGVGTANFERAAQVAWDQGGKARCSTSTLADSPVDCQRWEFAPGLDFRLPARVVPKGPQRLFAVPTPLTAPSQESMKTRT
ncbi:hypothetical protein, partial [Pollutimonas bauzanensis]|uniref:hypothetical protein n=1 Tax=Pollutimonas bauzanensis TaxID=658167 RepID=UPI00333E5AB6